MTDWKAEQEERYSEAPSHSRAVGHLINPY